MQVIDLELEGLKLIRPAVFGDERGSVVELYNAQRYAAAGIVETFVQDNHSHSVQGTLRGLHYQSHPGQAKLITVTFGRIWDVTVDIRPGSKTFGQSLSVELAAQNKELLFVPVGFAHGFCVLSEAADVQYKVSAHYDAAAECALNYADPELAIRWPIERPLLSARDQRAEPFASFRARVGR